MRCFLLVIFFLLSPAILLAEGGVSCHCFQDRAYDPDRPGIADQYVLATTRNSFISVLFDIPKQSIVKARMSGTSEEDLWLAAYLAQRTGSTTGEILKSRRSGQAWGDFIAGLSGFPESLDAPVARPVFARKPHADIVTALVDFKVATRLNQPAMTIAKMRKEGVSDEELILLALLSQYTDKPVEDLRQQSRNPALPLDMLLYQYGIAPKQLDPIMRHILTSREAKDEN